MKPRVCIHLLASMLAWAPALAPAQDIGVDTPPPAGAGARQQVLYQEALQSLAEGRKTDASSALSRLIVQEPEHAGAWLDLALIQCGLGNAEEAERLFANVETRFSPTREILELIGEARDSGCRPAAPASSASVNVGRGLDDNVNQGASNSTFIVTGSDGDIALPLLEDFLPKRDGYTSVGADYVRAAGANGSLGFLQLQQRRYDSMRTYDTGALYGGIESPWRFGAWTLRTTGSLGLTTMGGQLYQKQAQAQVRVAPPLPLPARTQFYLTASATHTRYLTLRSFDSDLFEARALLAHQAGTLAASATVGLLDDRARGARPGGNRHGNYLTVSLRRPLAQDVRGELSWTRQQWDSATPYSPELLIDQVRAQRTQVLRAVLTYQFARNQTVALEGRMVRNRENISIFQYNNRQLQLSWQWQYP
ncbi:M48 family metallopeptidase [Massilia sp. H6]|uniref:tetratricopeptide repeat protein n=1 Tax=Massilia sp. H6 TaxID=2970464 RepID=UPI0021683E1A|nr:tetratricopeptide repeat protein [Massilia sp. H6]UVW28138.1 tetratricopeptide repeat protein [Massilia sp. H6]